VIKWTGSAWAPRNDSTIPSGTAGGELMGTYPNPAIAFNSIKNVHIANGFLLIDTTLLGTGSIPQGDSQVVIRSVGNISNNSVILLTIGPSDNIIEKSIKIKSLCPRDSFYVSTISNDTTSVIIPFQYFILKR
jgi:hypothetical protein